mgnify:CR=1 FL=1
MMEPRGRLADVGLELFVNRGYDAVGVQQIVDASSVTKPTLYHHYGNKRGLLDALAVRVENRLFALLEPVLGYRGDLPVELEAIVAALLRFAGDHPDEARLLLASQNGPAQSETREALAGVWNRIAAGLEGFFRHAAADHGNMRGREREYTVSLLGMVFAYAVVLLDRRVGPDQLSPHRIMRQFSYGIYT